MDEIIARGLNAKRESKYIEFKSSFDPKSGRDWCEIIKHIVAISNTGDGVIIFGLHSNGTTSNYSIESIKSIDPALITDKIYKYTGHHFSEFQMVECEKGGSDLVALRIYPTEVPIIFENPGTYDIGDGKQNTAFSKGTIYFRHGAKSEPGSRDDIRKFVEK